METVKLVIWDLDETFWSGTLSEGGIEYRPEHHDLVLELSRRGVVNSIASKNDFEAVRHELSNRGIWDYFVFSKIAWRPKGEAIAQTIQEMGLRAPNVLFVDDNPQNLEEAKFYNPGLQVALPEVLATLLDEPAVKGKNDADLSRLKQYQMLERKVSDAGQAPGSNEDFLRQCDIRVELRDDCSAVFERLLEMIQRTNQLNFTKQRLDAEALRTLLADPDHRCAYVRVRDKYGDYGIAGFYALRAGRLTHFLFSCRILNMGVEQWLYNRLGRPRLDVVGETSDDPTALPVPDWIRLASESEEPGTAAPTNSLRIVLTGGCDLGQVADYLRGQFSEITGDFTYVNARNVPTHTEHTEILRRADTGLPDRYCEAYRKLPFFDEKSYSSKMLSQDFDVYIYSTLMDMTLGLYRYRDTDWVMPYFDFKIDLTDEANWDLLTRLKRYLNREFLEWFRENFTFEGCISTTNFEKNLRWLAQRIPPSKQLVLINGCEVELPHPWEHHRGEHHRVMNAVIQRVVDSYDHVDLCDVRKFIQSPEDVRDSIRHYSRRRYIQITSEVRDLISTRWAIRRNPTREYFGDFLKSLLVLGRRLTWNVVKHAALGRRRRQPQTGSPTEPDAVPTTQEALSER